MLYDKQRPVIDQDQTGLNFHPPNLQTHILRCCFQWRNLHRGGSAWHAKIHSCFSFYLIGFQGLTLFRVLAMRAISPMGASSKIDQAPMGARRYNIHTEKEDSET
jgi:hypothetical protein